MVLDIIFTFKWIFSFCESIIWNHLQDSYMKNQNQFYFLFDIFKPGVALSKPK
jgi:hypothetical protein